MLRGNGQKTPKNGIPNAEMAQNGNAVCIGNACLLKASDVV
jgi:hypothetical protein